MSLNYTWYCNSYSLANHITFMKHQLLIPSYDFTNS